MPLRRVATVLAGALALSAIAPVASAGAVPTSVTVLSTRPDLVSGGDVLLGVTGVVAADVQLTVDGQPAQAAVVPARDGAVHVLVSGLPVGPSTLRLDGTDAAVAVVNHPVTGPVLSGPHQSPYICQTNDAALGDPLDADCSGRTTVQYFYKSTNPGATLPNTPLADPCAPYPADLATTTTTEGTTAPYLIRVESGTVNRAVYRIAILDDPHARGCTSTYTPTAGWNERLVYAFGGGCGTGHHQGGSATSSFARADEVAFTLPTIGLGYAQMTTSLNEAGVSCNDVTSAESMAMLKEYFIERYGVPRWTLGRGGSGGALQQNMIASNYPGLLDGLITQSEFTDNTTVADEVLDCKLLDRVFGSNPALWNEAAKQAVTGFATSDTCATWESVFSPLLDPRNCDVSVPRELVYDPATNRGGTRCTLQDNESNIYGTDPATGFAPSWFDNLGVQYGLDAVRTGRITPQQFVDLNTAAGGLDIDNNPVATRSSAAVRTIETAYQSGRVTNGRPLGDIPILSLNLYVDPVPQFDVHDRVRPFITRARIARAYGDAGNQVIWTYNAQDLVYQPFYNPPAYTRALAAMTTWLDRITVDRAAGDAHTRVVRDRPAELVDECRAVNDGPAVTDVARCDALFPVHRTTRLVAGAPLTDDVLKCTLKPVDAADYASSPVPFTSAQLDALRAAFPSGVCDYGKPGIGQSGPVGTWLAYDAPYDPSGPGTDVPEVPRAVLLPLLGMVFLGVAMRLRPRRGTEPTG
jgi:hypothetical protein